LDIGKRIEMARKLFIAGNWKMNTTLQSGLELAEGLKEAIGSVEQIEMAFFPPAVYLKSICDPVPGSNIGVGAQNMYFEAKGAFTGEISGEMLRDVGCRYVLLGHSERRHVIGETDELINKKVLKALADGLDVILAVGELLEQRQAGQTMEVNRRQIQLGLAGVSAQDLARVTIAYEPVWAIGTGKTASPAQAQEVHKDIRKLLGEMYNEQLAQATRIQYGGSMKPDNAAELLGQPDVDGGLIGGASLKVADFAAIVKAGL
jgi:triosephosphate isomerase